MNPAPIYLLRGDEPDGPIAYGDVAAMLEKKQVTLESLSSIAGMPGWRSLAETRVWSQVKTLEPVLAEARSITSRIARHKFDINYARLELKQNLKHKKILTADLDVLGIVLEVNGLLERMHLRYSRREQYWNPDTLASSPMLQLDLSKSQKFARDWTTDWQRAGGQTYDGRMLARADDPVWFVVSDFGFPFPPFSFDGLAGIRSVNSAEAAGLGVADLDRPISLPEIPPLKFAGL